MALNELWTEKYRPKTASDYVFIDERQREQVMSWIKDKSVPTLLFTGSPGTGKTTLAKLLINEIEVDPYDILEINASRENSVDDIRDKITSFASTMPFGKLKVILLDEADFFSLPAQAALRGVIEEYHATVRFILTANFPNKIIPALHSRCQGFHIDKLDLTEFTARVATVLVTENIDFDLDTLDTYVKSTYPDLRKCLNSCQLNSSTGSLVIPSANDASTVDYKLGMVELFKKGKYREARQLLCSQARPEDMDEIFRWCYNDLSMWGDTDQQQDQAILIIRNAIVNHSMVADSEINLAACMVELAGIRQQH